MGNRNTRYFTKNSWSRRPLYQVVLAAVLAVTLLTGTGTALACAALIQSPQHTPTPVVEEAAPEPTPEETPEPTQKPVDVKMNVSVVQQDIGVELYTLQEKTPEEAVTAAPTASGEPEPTATAEAEEEPSKIPLTQVECTITITDAEGNAQDYPLDIKTGTILAEDVPEGDYTVAAQQKDGYAFPDAQTVTVTEKVDYTADSESIQKVKEKIKTASEVVESQEDSGGGSAQPEQLVDTVAYAESSQTQVGEETVTTPTLSDGYMTLKNGTVTGYKPVYENGVLVGACREAGIASLEAVEVSSLTDTAQTESKLLAGEDLPVPPGEATPVPSENAWPEETQSPATAEPTAGGDGTSPGNTEATAEPTEAPAEGSGWPEYIPVSDFSQYGFACESKTEVIYEYTGWQTIGGSRYYYNPENHQPVTGSQVIQGVVYSFKEDGTLNSTTRGIDVSKFQGKIDWNAVKADGIDFAIIRVGYRGYGSGALVEDSSFQANISGATAAGIPVGIYFYSQATNEEEAREEALMTIGLIQGYRISYPVFFDTERSDYGTGRADGISASTRTACAVAFCETIRSAGYTAGVYSYADWFYNYLNFSNLSKYRIWVAQYRDNLSFNYAYNIWQYTGSGKVNGVSTKVDMNIAY